MTFEPSICSRIAVLAPPTKKEANLLFDLLLRLGFDAQFSVRSMPSSLVASALEPLAARSWSAWQNADGIFQRDHPNQWSSACQGYKTDGSLNTRPSVDLLPEVLKPISIVLLQLQVCGNRIVLRVNLRLHVECLLVIKRARSLTDEFPAATTPTIQHPVKNSILGYQHRSRSPQNTGMSETKTLHPSRCNYRPLHSVYDYLLQQSKTRQRPTLARAPSCAPLVAAKSSGIAGKSVETPHAKTKAVVEVLDNDAAIAEELLDLAQWMSSYYHYPLGEVLATVLPNAARKGSPFEIKPEPPPDIWHLINAEGVSPRAKTQQALVGHLQQAGQPQSGDALAAAGFNRPMLRKLEDLGVVQRKALNTPAALAQPLTPTDEQRQAIEQVTASKRFEVFLLEGVTGSGKTEVYLQSMAPVPRRRQTSIGAGSRDCPYSPNPCTF